MTRQLSTQHYAIITLTALTALIHFVLGIFSLPSFFGVIFLLNGAGYLVLLAALYFIPQLADQRPLIRRLLLGYTAVTFVLYFVFNWPNVWAPMGLVDKAIELILIVLLLREG